MPRTTTPPPWARPRAIGPATTGGPPAGGHLTAMAMDGGRVAGSIAISGIYDLEPIRLNYLNEKLRLDEAEAARNSPILHLPSGASPLVVTVGLGELPELIRQSEEYARAWQQHGLSGEYLPLARHDHFSIREQPASLLRIGGAGLLRVEVVHHRVLVLAEVHG